MPRLPLALVGLRLKTGTTKASLVGASTAQIQAPRSFVQFPSGVVLQEPLPGSRSRNPARPMWLLYARQFAKRGEISGMGPPVTQQAFARTRTEWPDDVVRTRACHTRYRARSVACEARVSQQPLACSGDEFPSRCLRALPPPFICQEFIRRPLHRGALGVVICTQRRRSVQGNWKRSCGFVRARACLEWVFGRRQRRWTYAILAAVNMTEDAEP